MRGAWRLGGLDGHLTADVSESGELARLAHERAVADVEVVVGLDVGLILPVVEGVPGQERAVGLVRLVHHDVQAIHARQIVARLDDAPKDVMAFAGVLDRDGPRHAEARPAHILGLRSAELNACRCGVREGCGGDGGAKDE